MFLFFVHIISSGALVGLRIDSATISKILFHFFSSLVYNNSPFASIKTLSYVK